MPFLAMHGVAAQRGDGLRPELIQSLKRRDRVEGESLPPVSADETEARPIAEEIVFLAQACI